MSFKRANWRLPSNCEAIDALARMKEIENGLLKEKRLYTVTLPDGSVVTATRERIDYILRECKADKLKPVSARFNPKH